MNWKRRPKGEPYLSTFIEFPITRAMCIEAILIALHEDVDSGTPRQLNERRILAVIRGELARHGLGAFGGSRAIQLAEPPWYRDHAAVLFDRLFGSYPKTLSQPVPVHLNGAFICDSCGQKFPGESAASLWDEHEAQPKVICPKCAGWAASEAA